ncbi:MAG: hypothetical protein JNL11_17275 [Bdellovibrionaceae bacterium]|nr:hypothetical protein [Pseudobdellovibrionaceae bacterium]
MKPNTIAKIILLSFSSIILIGTFQNCAQSSGEVAFTPSVSGSYGGEPSSYMDKVDNVDLSKADYIDISLRSLYAESDAVYRSVKEYQNLKINLANGEMRYVDPEGHPINSTRLCLKPQELGELKAILEGSRVCQPSVPGDREDVVCTQVYKFPFAWLQYANGDKIKLGEVNGCARSLDLCEEHKQVFNGFVAYIRNHIDSRKCL